MVYYTYLLIDPRTNQPFYVGKGKGKRMLHHEAAVRNNSTEAKQPHHDRIREILRQGLTVVYDKVLIGVDEKAALERERILVEQYGRVNKGTGCLLNVSPGGKNSGIHERAVVQYTLDGSFVDEFDSALEAAEATPGNRAYITQCCKGKRVSSGGFLWAYKDAPIPVYTKKYYKQVEQRTLDGQLVAVHQSLTHAQQATGIELHCISEACRGKSKTAGGFVWQYNQHSSR